MDQKVLYRDDKNMMLAGVCSGLADYMNLDASVVRVITLLLAIFTGGTVLIAYIVMALVVPSKTTLMMQGKIRPDGKYNSYSKKEDYTIDPDDYKL